MPPQKKILVQYPLKKNLTPVPLDSFYPDHAYPPYLSTRLGAYPTTYPTRLS